MVDNLYFLYLDEIYAPNLNDMLRFNKNEIFEKNNHLHFGISGVIVASSCLYDLFVKSERIKSKYYPKSKNVIFHYVDILNSNDFYSDLNVNKKKNIAFKTSLTTFITSSEFKFDCVFVDKHELIKKYGIFNKENKLIKINKIGSNLFPKCSAKDYNLYLLCLRKMINNFYQFLTERKIQARGIVVAEARGEREDTELRDAFKKIYFNGVGSVGAKDIRRQILDLFIVPKKQNYFGTQIADLVLYPSYDGFVPSHNIRHDHFIKFEKNLKKKLIKSNNRVLP